MVRPAPRLFTKAPLGSGSFGLSAEQARYLGTVLRLPLGSEVRLFNGKDGEWIYHLQALERRGGVAVPAEQRRLQLEHQGSPVLLFAPLKRGPTEFIIQKATELGVAALQPVLTDRTNRENLRMDRLETIAIEAAEQCERLSVPVIKAPLALDLALDQQDRFIFCDEAGSQLDQPWGGDEGRSAPAGEQFATAAKVPDAILIGPEGGFTSDERDRLRADERALAVSLGPRILRAETAAIVALTLWQLRFGDLD
ncbi:MAG: 16S rRNA (uracil(1498)-N(3))-methyltransferase [Parvularculaceae bacterium]|nr:16S rRNA (uracil(1498)-N(3))-methyltransferase [Parvularculaceae bacterium]